MIATGQWTYALNNASDKVQQLNAGETKVETFEVTVTDEHGATSTQTISVTITGTNDIPVIDTDQSNFHLDFKEQGVYQPRKTATATRPRRRRNGRRPASDRNPFRQDLRLRCRQGKRGGLHGARCQQAQLPRRARRIEPDRRRRLHTVTGTGTPGTGDRRLRLHLRLRHPDLPRDGSYEYTLNNKNPGEAGADSNASTTSPSARP